MPKNPLSNFLRVDRNFQRSMRLDRDVLASDCLSGYVAQGSARRTLETMAAHINGSRQRSFTWTGPYGSGKSSLALLLCKLVGNAEDRALATNILSLRPGEPLDEAFRTKNGWDVLIMVGRQGNLTQDLAKVLDTPADSRAVVKALETRAAAQNAPDAFLVIIDELGKYLESDCASENAYLLQEIAEAANRCPQKFVFLGILHQAVDVYASRLPRTVRDEWSKVQGRFADLPLLSTSEETVDLLGHAIRVEHKPEKEDKAFVRAVEMVGAYRSKRRIDSHDMCSALLRCWPLNPVTTLLLGPISRRKFSQNERSIYSFLSAREPLGFQAFIESHEPGKTFDPADYWDYLKENFENQILTTADAHRWLTAVDAVQRAERTGDEELVNLAKSIALIDLFRSGSGLEATREILAASVRTSIASVEKLLSRLVELRVVIERRYADAFSIYAGSDFDIEAALREAQMQVTGLDTSVVEHLVQLSPVVAREYYLRMGTLRWFDRRILPISQMTIFASAKAKNDGAVGAFVLLLPDSEDDVISEDRLREVYAANGLSSKDNYSFILGVSKHGADIRRYMEELQALLIVEKSPELEGDETGRREVQTRIEFARNALMESVDSAFTTSTWVSDENKSRSCTSTQELSNYASSLCDDVFTATPAIVNELINRDYLSTPTSAARKDLMIRMVTNTREEALGFTGFPPAYALYLSMLADIHVKGEKGYEFRKSSLPEEEDNYGPLWKATEEFLKARPMVTGKELLDFWSKPPFGLKKGPMPILALMFYLLNKDNLAVYLAGTFQPAMTAVTVDEWLVDPTRIAFRWVDLTKEHTTFLKTLTSELRSLVQSDVEETPLAAARALVATVLNSPRWSQRSTSFTPATLKLKNVVAKASDPIQLLYRDIPSIYEMPVGKELAHNVVASLREFVAAMPAMLQHVKEHLFTALRASESNLEALRERARNIKGLSGDMTLEAFIARLERFENKASDIEGIISLATSRPAQMWTDREVQVCISKISELAYAFRKQESFASLRGRRAGARVLSFTCGDPSTDLTEDIELTAEEDEKARLAGKRVAELLASLPRNVALAALSDAGIELASARK